MLIRKIKLQPDAVSPNTSLSNRNKATTTLFIGPPPIVRMIQNEEAFADDTAEKAMEISKDIQEVGEEAFKECSNLKKVVATCGSLRKIGYGAFWNCRQLVQVHLLLEEGGSSSLQDIADMAFCGCISLETIQIPDTVVEIGRFAFQECRSLVNMDLSPRLEILGQYAFCHCSALLHMSIPGTVQVIENHCFSYCRSLLSVELHEGLTHLGEYAFLDCMSMSAISIPESTIFIGAGCFSECVNLLGVELLVSTESISDAVTIELEAFRGCQNLVNFYCASRTNIEEAIDYEAFDGCSRLMLLGMNRDENSHRNRNRFENLPVHRACYHASTTTMNDLRVAMADGADIIGGRDWKDAFGMTPFHIVATSSKLRLDILQVLLDHCPPHLLSEQDIHGRTMMDYLLVNRVPKSVEIIKLVLEKTLVAKLEVWGWKNKGLSDPFSVQIDSMDWGRTSKLPVGEVGCEDGWWEAEWEAAVWKRRQSLKEIISLFERYAAIEVTSILELGLWKRSNTIEGDRESSRMMCGAEVVLPNVVGFLCFGYGESLGGYLLKTSYCI